MTFIISKLAKDKPFDASSKDPSPEFALLKILFPVTCLLGRDNSHSESDDDVTEFIFFNLIEKSEQAVSVVEAASLSLL